MLSSGGTTTKNALSYVNGLIPSAQESSIVLSNEIPMANDSVAIPSTELNAQSYVDNLLNTTDQRIRDDIDGIQNNSIQQYDIEQFASPTNTNGLLMGNFTGSSNSHQLLDEAAEIIDDDEESMYQEDDFEEDVTPGQQSEKA